MFTLSNARAGVGGSKWSYKFENKMLLQSRFRYINKRVIARKENAYEM